MALMKHSDGNMIIMKNIWNNIKPLMIGSYQNSEETLIPSESMLQVLSKTICLYLKKGD